MSENTLLELAERCEKATGPNRELDARIHYELHGLNRVYAVEVFLASDISESHPKPFTGSIDAALTLVPEGWRWQVSDRAPTPHKGRAYLHNDQLHFANHMRPNPKYKHTEITAATPALALCAAALRAIPPPAAP